MFRKLYFSSFGYLISLGLRILGKVHDPFMVYGFYNRVSQTFQKYSRISSSAKLINKKNIDLADHVWIGHYCLVDGTGGVSIGEGSQISSHTVIYSHSSQDAIRMLGKEYIKVAADQRPGYKLKPVSIGSYTFIGTSCVILPGASIGKGCIVGAGSVIRGDVPDYAIVSGNPAQVIGDTRDRDQSKFAALLDKNWYYDTEALTDRK
ncbi:MAG: acyltransferase [Bacteroidales bacterium]|nr:acyltransferase [Bacteroidales bacterium]